MKSNFLKKLSIGAAVICATGLVASAAPLQRSDIPVNPTWLVHLDCDALRATTIGQYVVAEMDKPEAKDKLAAFQAIFSFDLRTQLHGATFFGNSKGPDDGVLELDGVLVLYADFDPDRLVTLAKAAKDYQSTGHNKHVIHNWINEKKKGTHGDKPRFYAAIQGNRVIFGQREDAVSAALDVLDGIAPSLPATAFPDLGVSGNSNFIEVAVRKLDIPDAAPNAAILRLSKTLQVLVGEKDRQFQAAVTLVADTDEAAGHIASIAQGLMALMSLQTNQPDSVKLANAISIKQNGSSVLGTVTLPAGDAVAMMKADAARKAAAAKAKESKD
jgi:hypothetical protein